MWITAAVMAASSLYASSQANSQASKNAKAQAGMLLQNYKKQTNDLQLAADEVNRQIGMELTKQQFQSTAQQASFVAKASSGLLAGNTVAKQMNALEMGAEMRKDTIQQAGESKITDVLGKLDESLMNYKSGIVDAEITKQNNTTSGISMALGAVQSGMQGYAMGSNLGFGGTETTYTGNGINEGGFGAGTSYDVTGEGYE
jgi:hypothetical protein